MLRTLEAPPDPELLRCATQSMDPTPTFNQSFIESTLTLLRRQLLVTYRNKPFILGGLLMITVMGLLYCTVFYDFDPTEVSVVLGVVFSSVMFVSMGQSSQIATYMAEREIFYKQRGANFFRTGSYVLATSASNYRWRWSRRSSSGLSSTGCVGSSRTSRCTSSSSLCCFSRIWPWGCGSSSCVQSAPTRTL